MSIYDSDFTMEDAEKADKAASTIDENGYYILKILKVQQVLNTKESKSAEFFFEGPGGSKLTHSFVVEKPDGSEEYGLPIVKGIAYLVGVKLKDPVPGKVELWTDTEKGRKRVETDGMVFKGFEEKSIGVVIQKRLYTNDKTGKDAYEMKPILFCDPKTKMTASEMKAGKTKAEKVDKKLATLKTLDQRKAKKSVDADLFKPGDEEGGGGAASFDDE